MQTPLKARAALVFASKRGGLFYWAGSVQVPNWPRHLRYKTMVLVPATVSQGSLAQLRAR